ncbi:hypothetical protein NEIPOLOT_02418 [Neisseria polysaccharea ATCC 43768]|nr:hypothetical protein NEIPOLOT_02418 [Neisseria polysaccharea ATCC 43768]
MIFRFCGKDGVSDCGYCRYFLFGNAFVIKKPSEISDGFYF